jgi:nucleotide-binding universal stress UspA family protein
MIRTSGVSDVGAPGAADAGAYGGRAIHGSLLIVGDADDNAYGPLRLAELLARRHRVRAHVLGVVRPIGFPVWEHMHVDAEVLEDARRRQYLDRLRQHVHGTVGRSVHFSVDVVTGSPASSIAAAARAGGASYILTAVAPHGTAARFANEDAALQLARAVDVPVVAVPSECIALPSHALVATDFSAPSTRSAYAALALLAPGATITLAHVEPDADLRATGDEDWAERYERGVGSLFGELEAGLAGSGDVTVETVLLHGDPAPALLSHAERAGCDLIATGTQSMPESGPRLTGSVSTALLRGARVAVLLAPPAEAVR